MCGWCLAYGGTVIYSLCGKAKCSKFSHQVCGEICIVNSCGNLETNFSDKLLKAIFSYLLGKLRSGAPILWCLMKASYGNDYNFGL